MYVRQQEPPAFGVLLRRMRLAAGLTQEELSDRARLSERAIRRLERDHDRTPRLQTIRLLAEALDLAPAERARLLTSARPTSAVSDVARRHPSLPHFLTPLIGRTDDIAVIVSLLEAHRLVTVTGTGGVGKTRLVLATAETLVTGFDRVTFVELGSLRDPAAVLGKIAQALAIRETESTSLFDLVASTLESGRTLLVLDNMEHLLAARDVVLDLVGACPTLSMLITSREALRVQGEEVYILDPLPLPERDAAGDDSPAVCLFLDRAREAGATQAHDDATIRAVVQICRRLDGVPLAIELAAARATVLSPELLLARLDRSLPLLTRGQTDLPQRHQTMRDTIAWSYDLLDPKEQTLFQTLSVFPGGCTLDAVEAVCRGPEHPECEAIDTLAALVDKCLVVAHRSTEVGREARFGMLETIREFAHDQLLATSDAASAYREQAHYFLGLAEEAQSELSGPDQPAWLDRLEREHDNLRAALLTAQQHGDGDLGLRFVVSLWPFWLARGHFKEAQRWVDVFLPRSESSGASVAVRAYALYVAGTLATVHSGNERAGLLLREALVLARESGNARCIATIIHQLGGCETARGNYLIASRLLEESLVLYRQLDDQPGMGAVLTDIAGLARYQGEYERATTLYQEALVLSRETGDLGRVGYVLARIGNLASEQGRPSDSLPLYEESLALRRHLGDTFGIADVLYRFGETAADMGDYTAATELYEESLELYRSLGNKYGMAYVLLDEGEAALGMGRLAEAKELAAQTLALFQMMGDRRCIAFALMQLADIAREQQDYQPSLALYQESLSLHWSLKTRPEIARCLERMARLATVQGLVDRAALLHGGAAALRETMHSKMSPADGTKHERSMMSIRAVMGTEGFAATEKQGRNQTLEHIVSYALGRAYPRSGNA